MNIFQDLQDAIRAFFRHMVRVRRDRGGSGSGSGDDSGSGDGGSGDGGSGDGGSGDGGVKDTFKRVLDQLDEVSIHTIFFKIKHLHAV